MNMLRTSRRSAVRGFTLIELLTTIAIAAVLLFVGVPSFLAYQRNSELTSVTNALVAAINAARGEAMKRGLPAMVIPKTDTDWASGWVVFVDTNRSSDYDPNSDLTIAQQDALPSYFSATGSTGAGSGAQYVMFDPSGFSKVEGSAAFQSLTISVGRNDLSGAEKQEQTRLLIVAASGRVRSCKPSTDATCTTGATE